MEEIFHLQMQYMYVCDPGKERADTGAINSTIIGMLKENVSGFVWSKCFGLTKNCQFKQF